jgi:hypothetical protein
MKGWLAVLGLWSCSALICLPAVIGGIGGPATYLALTFLVLLIGFSAYLYSPPFTGLIDSILRRTKAARTTEDDEVLSA